MLKRILAFIVAIGLIALPASADVKISGLPSVTVPAGADLVPIVHSGVTSQASITNIFGNAPAISGTSASFSSTVTATSGFLTGSSTYGPTSATVNGPISGTTFSANGAYTGATGDIGAARTGSTGNYYFGSTSTTAGQLGFDGTNYVFYNTGASPASIATLNSSNKVLTINGSSFGATVNAGGAYTGSNGDIGAARSTSAGNYYFGSNSGLAGQLAFDGTYYNFYKPGITTATSQINSLTGAYLVGSSTYGASATISGVLTSTQSGGFLSNTTGATTQPLYMDLANTGSTTYFGAEGSAGGQIFSGTAAYATVLGSASGTSLQFVTSNAPRLTISASGAATFAQTISTGGLITSTVSSGAVFSDTSGTTGNLFSQFQNTGNTTYFGTESSAGSTLFSGTAAYATALGTSSARSLQFVTSNAVRQTIDSAGAVTIPNTLAIGSGSPQSTGDLAIGRTTTSAALFFGSVGAGGAAYITYNTNVSGSFALNLTSGGYSPITTGTISAPHALLSASVGSVPTGSMDVGTDGAGGGAFFLGSASTAFNFKNNNGGGYAALNASAFNVSSDRRFKKDIRPIPYGLGAVAKLKPSAFTFKASGKHDLGFIAQDVERVLPELVTKDSKGYRLVNYSGIIPILTRAIQQQQTEIVALQKQVKTLKPAQSGSFLDRLHWLFFGS